MMFIIILLLCFTLHIDSCYVYPEGKIVTYWNNIDNIYVLLYIIKIQICLIYIYINIIIYLNGTPIYIYNDMCVMTNIYLAYNPTRQCNTY